MAGHSKWKNNLGRKTAQDAKRSKSFGKLSRAITIAVLEGGSADPNFNPRLRVAIEKAKEDSMPKDNIERAIAKGSGPDKNSLHSILYEIFGPGGVHILATATSDSPNRTNSEIHSMVERHHGKMGSSGSVRHMFVHCGLVIIQNSVASDVEEKLLMLAENLQALDIETEDEENSMYFPFTMMGKAPEILQASQMSVISQPQVIYKPIITTSITDEIGEKLATLIEILENHDEVQDVFHNAI